MRYAVQNWQERTKKKLVDALGGKCAKCGYNACLRALDFHHINSREKNFSISDALNRPKKWDILIEETAKCALLCCRCHRELHHGQWNIEDIGIPKPVLERRILKKDTPTGKCLECDSPVFFGREHCSKTCSGKGSRRIIWPEKDILKKMLEESSCVQVAKKLGVSDNAVKKWAQKYGIWVKKW